MSDWAWGLVGNRSQRPSKDTPSAITRWLRECSARASSGVRFRRSTCTCELPSTTSSTSAWQSCRGTEARRRRWRRHLPRCATSSPAREKRSKSRRVPPLPDRLLTCSCGLVFILLLLLLLHLLSSLFFLLFVLVISCLHNINRMPQSRFRKGTQCSPPSKQVLALTSQYLLAFDSGQTCLHKR